MDQQIGDWRSAVAWVLGGSPDDAVKSIQDLLAKDGPIVKGFGGKPQLQYNWRAFSQLRPALVVVGLDKYTAVQVEQAFGSGAAAQGSAKLLGLGAQFAAGGQLGLRPVLV